MDTLWNCAYGIDINMQTSADQTALSYFSKCERVFKESEELSPPIYFGSA